MYSGNASVRIKRYVLPVMDPLMELASHGWHLIGNSNDLVEGAGPVDGITEFLIYTWAELFGVCAIVEFLHYFCEFHNIESTSWVIKCCDNCIRGMVKVSGIRTTWNANFSIDLGINSWVPQ